MKLSVIIPTYNRPNLLKRTLESVSCYPPGDIEIIVINDGSITNYSETISMFKNYISQYIALNDSKGVSHARNIGIGYATGDWVLFVDDDDEIADGYISSLISCASELKSSIGFVWGNVHIYKYHKQSVKIIERQFKYSSEIELAFHASTIGASFGLAVRRDALNMLGGFDTDLTVGEDTDLIIRLLSVGFAPFHIDVLSVKKHDHNGGRLTNDFLKYSEGQVYEIILDRYENYLKLNGLIFENLVVWSFYIHIISSNFLFALATARRARIYGIKLTTLITRSLNYYWKSL